MISSMPKETSSSEIIEKDNPLLRSFFKTLLFTSIFIFSFLVITIVAGGLFIYAKVNQFSSSAQITNQQLKRTINDGLSTQVVQTDGKINFLILGVDSLDTRGDSLPLTDTIILASLDIATGKLTTLPFPRDLWSSDYQTKINALYTYGLEKYPESPEQFPTEVISDWTGLDIHYPIVLSMEQVSDIVDLLGGIEVNIEKGFVDNEFPRPDVDVTSETDPEKLYMTVEFNPGKEIMTGERALQYIRSRHSQDLDAGTDNARSERQQQVIQSLISRIKQKEVIYNPALLGQLYRYYLDNFEKKLPTTQLIAIAKTLYPVREQIIFKNTQMTIYPDDANGLIYHPATYLTNNLWVYQIRNLETFPQDILSLIK